MVVVLRIEAPADRGRRVTPLGCTDNPVEVLVDLHGSIERVLKREQRVGGLRAQHADIPRRVSVRRRQEAAAVDGEMIQDRIIGGTTDDAAFHRPLIEANLFPDFAHRDRPLKHLGWQVGNDSLVIVAQQSILEKHAAIGGR